MPLGQAMCIKYVTFYGGSEMRDNSWQGKGFKGVQQCITSCLKKFKLNKKKTNLTFTSVHIHQKEKKMGNRLIVHTMFAFDSIFYIDICVLYKWNHLLTYVVWKINTPTSQKYIQLEFDAFFSYRPTTSKIQGRDNKLYSK